jgi:hypothetical protein
MDGQVGGFKTRFKRLLSGVQKAGDLHRILSAANEIHAILITLHFIIT